MNDKLKIRLLGLAAAVFAAAAAILAYKFIIAGSTEESPDGRTAILLEPAERALVLAEMRGFVEAVRDITGALAKDDAPGAAAAAARVGMHSTHEVPATILGKLPLEFKTLGFSVHDAFDRLGMDAKDLRDTKHSLEQLSAILARCAGCHASYQLKAVGP